MEFRLSSVKTEMDSSVETPSRKRVAAFLSTCGVEVKKRKVDIAVLIARKMGEKRRCEDQRGRLQQQLIKLTESLQVKEMQIDAVDQELKALNDEHELDAA